MMQAKKENFTKTKDVACVWTKVRDTMGWQFSSKWTAVTSLVCCDEKTSAQL